MNNSWWPLGMSLGSFMMMTNVLYWFKYGSSNSMNLLIIMGTLILMTMWFRDITREGSYQGYHTEVVYSALKWGLVWFLFSEVWFFFSVFWSFFHLSLAPSTSGMSTWPNLGIMIIPPFQVPLLNTVILLMSGVTATLAHNELLGSIQTNWLLLSVSLGVYFLILQSVEYLSSSYSMASGAYGSVFFFGTGFHGIHVCLGAVMLLVSGLRMLGNNLSSHHHFGVEFSLWYWHFVDVVWLFLFFWVYAWGS